MAPSSSCLTGLSPNQLHAYQLRIPTLRSKTRTFLTTCGPYRQQADSTEATVIPILTSFVNLQLLIYGFTLLMRKKQMKNLP